jgi:hypothetical protein
MKYVDMPHYNAALYYVILKFSDKNCHCEWNEVVSSCHGRLPSSLMCPQLHGYQAFEIFIAGFG